MARYPDAADVGLSWGDPLLEVGSHVGKTSVVLERSSFPTGRWSPIWSSPQHDKSTALALGEEYPNTTFRASIHRDLHTWGSPSLHTNEAKSADDGSVSLVQNFPWSVDQDWLKDKDSAYYGSNSGSSNGLSNPSSDRSTSTVLRGRRASTTRRRICASSPGASSKRSIICDVCGKRSWTPSEARKHKSMHDRPFVCREPDCSGATGFAYNKDLERHRKSVHAIVPSYGNSSVYRCAACPAGLAKDKCWSRRDNFFAHVRRKHPSLNASDLALISECRMSSEANGDSHQPTWAIKPVKEDVATPLPAWDVVQQEDAQRLRPGSNRPSCSPARVLWPLSLPAAGTYGPGASKENGTSVEDPEAGPSGTTSSPKQASTPADGNTAIASKAKRPRPERDRDDEQGDDGSGLAPKKRKHSAADEEDDAGVFPCVCAAGDPWNKDVRCRKKWPNMSAHRYVLPYPLSH